MGLPDVLRDLASDDSDTVTDAARKLGLLLERERFRKMGVGSLGDLSAMLGDLVDVELTRNEARAAVDSLVAHLERRGRDANPTVVWAIGKSHDGAKMRLLERLASEVMADPERAALVYQLVSVLAMVSPERYRTTLLRAAQEAVGDARELARHLIDTRGWA